MEKKTHHPSSDIIPDTNTHTSIKSQHVTRVAKNILTNAAESLLLEIYPKSIIEDTCKDLSNSEIYHRPYVKVANKLLVAWLKK